MTFFFGNPVTLSCSIKQYTKKCVYKESKTANQISTSKCLNLTGHKTVQKISEVPRFLGEACMGRILYVLKSCQGWIQKHEKTEKERSRSFAKIRCVTLRMFKKKKKKEEK